MIIFLCDEQIFFGFRPEAVHPRKQQVIATHAGDINFFFPGKKKKKSTSGGRLMYRLSIIDRLCLK